jgi:acylglycerol lipase
MLLPSSYSALMIEEIKRRLRLMSKFLPLLISTLIIVGCESSDRRTGDMKGHPFSFLEIESSEKTLIPSLHYIKARDKTRLAYREYIPKDITAVLIFYHGGGAHSGAGYQHIGYGLKNRFNVAVYTPDIRGHGYSGGERGDTSSPDQVFDDIGLFIRHIRTKHPKKALFLGGHSSGAGLVLNYSDLKKREKVEGYIFLSPYLGFRSNTENKNNKNPFATVKTSLFVENAMHGTHGNSKAVFFNYPEEILKKDTKLITAITVNMSNALTPSSPGEQLQDLKLPLAVWIGKEDEVLDATRVISFIKANSPKSFTKVVEGEKHLSILLNAPDYIGPWIHDVVH